MFWKSSKIGIYYTHRWKWASGDVSWSFLAVFFAKLSAFSRESKGNAFQNQYFYVFQLPQLKYQQFLVKFVHFRRENTWKMSSNIDICTFFSFHSLNFNNIHEMLHTLIDKTNEIVLQHALLISEIASPKHSQSTLAKNMLKPPRRHARSAHMD